MRDYAGLVRHYREPFTADRHEALDPSLAFVARYGRDGALLKADSKK